MNLTPIKAWLKCIFFTGHKWHVPKQVELRFNEIGIYNKSLMRHFCKHCHIGENSMWTYYC